MLATRYANEGTRCPLRGSLRTAWAPEPADHTRPPRLTLATLGAAFFVPWAAGTTACASGSGANPTLDGGDAADATLDTDPEDQADAQPRDAAPEAANGPTFTQLFEGYFAPGTPGHCATPGCHADPGHNVWLCTTAETCYQGMLGYGLIDPLAPERSVIVDPSRSPLVWFNPAAGNMPFDAQTENDAGRAAIAAWIAAGAPFP